MKKRQGAGLEVLALQNQRKRQEGPYGAATMKAGVFGVGAADLSECSCVKFRDIGWGGERLRCGVTEMIPFRVVSS